MIKIYSNPNVNMFYIEGVAEGSVDAFTAQQNGDFISIWRNGLQVYEFQNVHYSQLADSNNAGFASAANAMAYINSLLTVSTVLEKSEIPSGLINGSNAIFLTSLDYISETVKVFSNGILQREGLDYSLVPPRTIQFNFSPLLGETIHVVYKEL